MDIQTALITAIKCLIRVFLRILTRLDQVFGQVYRIRIGPDCSMKILDWTRIAKFSNLLNTSMRLSIVKKRNLVLTTRDIYPAYTEFSYHS